MVYVRAIMYIISYLAVGTPVSEALRIREASFVQDMPTRAK
jgi:hypothetical protein